MKKIHPSFLMVLLAAMASFSCVTYKQDVAIKPISADTPSSLTRALQVNDRIYLPTDYEVRKDFSFTQTFRNPLLNSSTASVSLDSKLKEYLVQNNGDAIVGLSIELLNVDNIDPVFIVNERFLGLLGIGMVIYPTALMIGEGRTFEQAFTPDVLIGMGALTSLLGVSFIHESLGSINYTYKVSGTVVHLKSR